MSIARSFAVSCSLLAMVSPALADPYSLPIAGSGPVGGTEQVAASTRSMQDLAKQVGFAQFTAPNWRPGEVRHIVLFQYKPSTTAAQRAEVTGRFLHLVQDSRRPDGAQVIASIETGMQNGGEGNSGGFQQAFIVTFKSEGDRNFYSGAPVITDSAFYDSAHAAFKDFAKPFLQNSLTFDFDVLATVSSKRHSGARHHKK